ncbi:hypothetical protein DPMN_089400 [Dreissena polymorpha]|uniref:BTB domain-containing protein n=1 Tax=Dreissena polymorpha TaxID=45954 RepID=A0A9D4KWB7_DREPO|nr:hypothetical protein DPMN_089400 [Dreissena polymorpha]
MARARLTRISGLPHFPEDTEASDGEIKERDRVAAIFKLSYLQIICQNMLTEQAFLNPSMGTYLSNETGVPQNMIHIPNTTKETFVTFLEYLYTDHSAIEHSDAVHIIVLADEYGQKRLLNLCELYITNDVNRSVSKRIEPKSTSLAFS